MDMNAFSRLSERDIDLLVIEELLVSDVFLCWYLKTIGLHDTDPFLVGAWHSVSLPGHGESDIVVVFDNDERKRVGILIENKIDASEMDRQGARYQQRGQLGVESGDWVQFHTCMMAPQRYLNIHFAQEKYDRSLSYEAISDFFARQPTKRDLYRSQIVLWAIEQQRRGYVQVEHQKLSEYIRQYIHHASEAFPQLNVQDWKPRPAENDWVEFYPYGSGTSFRTVHQNRNGRIKVFIRDDFNDQAHYLEHYSGVEIDGESIEVSLTKTGTVSLGVAVPPIDGKTELFSVRCDDVVSTLRRLTELVELIKRIERTPQLEKRLRAG